MENFNRYGLAIPMYNQKNVFIDIPIINLPGISVNSVKYRGEEALPFVLNAFEEVVSTYVRLPGMVMSQLSAILKYGEVRLTTSNPYYLYYLFCFHLSEAMLICEDKHCTIVFS